MQEEINALTGEHRLPSAYLYSQLRYLMINALKRHTRTRLYLLRILLPFSKASLPYVDALIQEVLRRNTTGPLAAPHQLVQDDEYQGRMGDFN